MVDQCQITRIASITSGGIFADFECSSELDDFAEKNLIYGFNGSGKSTLSRVISSAGNDQLPKLLPAGCQYEILLSDGSKLSVGDQNSVSDRILVFNSDFVSENLTWTTGEASPVYYVGKDQTGTVQALEAKRNELPNIETAKWAADRDASTKSSAFSRFKTDRARVFASELNLGRRYQSPNFAGDCDGFDKSAEHKLPDQDATALRSLVHAQTPTPKVQLISQLSRSISTLCSSAEQAVTTTIGDLVIAELQKHDSMLSWVREGFHYHTEQGLDDCLFCGNKITKERLAALNSALTNKLDDLVTTIESEHSKLDRLRSDYSQCANQLPRSAEISPERQAEFPEAEQALKEALREGGQAAERIQESLNKKLKSPHHVSAMGKDCPTVDQVNIFEGRINTAVDDLNEILRAHNESFDEFRRKKDKARARLKQHLVQESVEDYEKLKRESDDAEAHRQSREKALSDIQGEIRSLEEQLRQHAIAAETINGMIKAYLGHDELKLRALDSGYEITRRGVPLDGPLSEGEKTAIALCYFLASLEAEGRKIENLIVVLDDPISSLDTRALNYAMSMIKAYCASCLQLFILTHNLYFMNEAKKWIAANRDEGKKKLYFLDVSIDQDGNTRSVSISKMPKYIREYESEYHYLFHLTMEFVESKGEDQDYFYVLPNALRKVLDIFLAFKVPNADGLQGKLRKIANDTEGLDEVKVGAINRLIQLESHADSLDDLVTMSSLTVEEVHDAAIAVLDLIRIVDEQHHKQMCKLCN